MNCLMLAIRLKLLFFYVCFVSRHILKQKSKCKVKKQNKKNKNESKNVRLFIATDFEKKKNKMRYSTQIPLSFSHFFILSVYLSHILTTVLWVIFHETVSFLETKHRMIFASSSLFPSHVL